jgi:acyl-CoA thioesterase
MEHELDRGIAVVRSDDGVYDVHLDPGWVVGGGVNGGYVLAVVGNALRAELTDVGQPDPLSVSAYFLTPSRPGPARVRLRKVRVGGRRTTVAASLVQDEDGFEVERVSLLGVYGSLGEPGEVERQVPQPDLPPVEECLDASDASEEFLRAAPLLQRFGTRFDPEHAGWRTGKPSGQGVVQGWFKLADDRPLDPVALLLVVDALPPATYDLGRPGWAPTLELTAHVRAKPAPGWAIVRHATHNVSGGQFEEDCEVWDSTGRLVAQSRQLALLPR